ncbi:MAG TPA: TlpA disulfide reductase family protein [Candidatus Acidoferrum sp.]|nr:TlpA disulfide reductase family protein [Candidatus Acidoferrum sp.]
MAAAAVVLVSPATAVAQQTVNWTAQEKPIYDQIKTLRRLPDDVRARTTRQLALQIRELPATPEKVRLAAYLASRATEGDFGHDTLQEVATSLADALRGQPPQDKPDPLSLAAYSELAQLVRYEHVQVSMDAPQYRAALAKLEADDQRRQQANFTLTDLQGKTWTLKDLKGKVVLVNFWATWCPPCQKEMPDLEALYHCYKDQGFVILAISEDEEAGKVPPFIAERRISYPILLDPGRKVNDLFQIEGIPKSFVYDRKGKLVTESIDMRTRRQFQEMLAQAGLR